MVVQQIIQEKITQALNPSFLDVTNESHMHSVPPNSETHFKLVVVSDQFEGKRSLARHQQVYAILAQELAAGVHALALHTYTPADWLQRQGNSPASPSCKGGSKA